MFAGRLPFEHEEPIALVHAHVVEQPAPLVEVRSEIPFLISRIVPKMLEKNAEDRYRSAEGVAHDLERFLFALEAGADAREFPLGTADISPLLEFPQALYGREMEAQAILGAFQRSCSESGELVLVAGYSGIGKTALIHEVQRPLVAAGGFFAEGKYEQLSRTVPYSAFIGAFQGLIRQIQSLSATDFDRFRERLSTALRPNGRVIVDVLPDLEGVVGPQPEVPELGPVETAHRFRKTLLNFFDALLHAKHP